MSHSSESKLPAGWVECSIGDTSQTKVEQGPPSGRPVPYIEIGSVDNKRKAIGELRKVDSSTAPSRARQWVESGDVLVSMTRPNLNAVALVPPNLDGAVASTGFDIIRTIEMPPEWIFYRVQSTAFVADVCGGIQGVVYPAIRPADVRGHSLPLAPKKELIRIIETVESYLSRLGTAEDNLERVQKSLKRYRASVLKAAVEGRLVPTEAGLARQEGRDYEPAPSLLERILEERKRRWIESTAETAQAKAEEKAKVSGKSWSEADNKKALEKGLASAVKKYKEPLSPNTDELPALPEGWCWTSIGQVFEVQIGATPRRNVSEYWNGDIPWVSSGEVAFCHICETKESISNKGLTNSSTQLNPPGTVLLAMIGEGKTRGQAAILDIHACNNQNAAAIRVSDTPIAPDYIFYILMEQYEINRRKGSGGNQPALNKSRVQGITFPLPPLSELTRIAEGISQRLVLIDHLANELGTSIHRCQRLRQATLKWAFEGKLVDQDPNDESAAILLESLKTERAANKSASLKTMRN